MKDELGGHVSAYEMKTAGTRRNQGGVASSLSLGLRHLRVEATRARSRLDVRVLLMNFKAKLVRHTVWRICSRKNLGRSSRRR